MEFKVVGVKQDLIDASPADKPYSEYCYGSGKVLLEAQDIIGYIIGRSIKGSTNVELSFANIPAGVMTLWFDFISKVENLVGEAKSYKDSFPNVE